MIIYQIILVDKYAETVYYYAKEMMQTSISDKVKGMLALTGKKQIGIYACSPEQSSFKAIFTDMKLTECAWKAHDGQQPD